MIHPDYLSASLVTQFDRIYRERMRDLPFINPALSVEAVGFRRWDEKCLGVLVTPWFMNLMLLPCEGDTWQDMEPGTARLYRLPSGGYEFILAEEPGIGRYQFCSLFSPMFEFADQDAAVETARAALEAVMSEQPIRTSEGQTASVSGTPAESRVRTISRRDLLRGAFSRGDARDTGR